MSDLEFVTFDAAGREFESLDPYLGHFVEDGVYHVNNGWGTYGVQVPAGGRYVIRHKAPFTRGELLQVVYSRLPIFAGPSLDLANEITDAVMGLFNEEER